MTTKVPELPKPPGPEVPKPPGRVENPLPIETVRDLLGIVRVLYALQRAQGNRGYARELSRAGQQLRRALELAVQRGDNEAHVAAWQLANSAIRCIARVQADVGGELTSLVRLATERVAFGPIKPGERDARRQARIKRG